VTIEHITTEELPALVAGLVREGVTFRAYPKGPNWTIELLGGY
jgi:hypothetical protein